MQKDPNTDGTAPVESRGATAGGPARRIFQPGDVVRVRPAWLGRERDEYRGRVQTVRPYALGYGQLLSVSCGSETRRAVTLFDQVELLQHPPCNP